MPSDRPPGLASAEAKPIPVENGPAPMSAVLLKGFRRTSGKSDSPLREKFAASTHASTKTTPLPFSKVSAERVSPSRKKRLFSPMPISLRHRKDVSSRMPAFQPTRTSVKQRLSTKMLQMDSGSCLPTDEETVTEKKNVVSITKAGKPMPKRLVNEKQQQVRGCLRHRTQKPVSSDASVRTTSTDTSFSRQEPRTSLRPSGHKLKSSPGRLVVSLKLRQKDLSVDGKRASPQGRKAIPAKRKLPVRTSLRCRKALSVHGGEKTLFGGGLESPADPAPFEFGKQRSASLIEKLSGHGSVPNGVSSTPEIDRFDSRLPFVGRKRGHLDMANITPARTNVSNTPKRPRSSPNSSQTTSRISKDVTEALSLESPVDSGSGHSSFLPQVRLRQPSQPHEKIPGPVSVFASPARPLPAFQKRRNSSIARHTKKAEGEPCQMETAKTESKMNGICSSSLNQSAVREIQLRSVQLCSRQGEHIQIHYARDEHGEYPILERARWDGGPADDYLDIPKTGDQKRSGASPRLSKRERNKEKADLIHNH